VTVLWETGYVVIRSDRDQLVFNAGPLGADHLPPHAHAHALSFVLWADGAQVLVDPGSFSYTGHERNRFRGTEAHNTVEVDGRDQCEFWGDFRAAFMPTVSRAAPVRHGRAVVLSASHDGYRRLDDAVVHHRTVVWVVGDGVVVVDRLQARTRHAARSSLHVSPNVQAEQGRVGPFTVAPLTAGGVVGLVRGEYAPFLGIKAPAPVLEERRTAEPGVPFGWSVLRSGREARLQPGRVVVTREGRDPLDVPLPPLV
jgi:hypothetical protein